jgi:hypothetical protein
MSELERIETKDKWGDFQKKYNATSKGIARLFGTNVALFVCILLPILLIGFIWTDFGIPTIGTKFISEGIVTVALFVIGEVMMSKIGADGGKLDTEYTTARNDFITLVNNVHDIGTSFLNLFCDWQIDVEFEHATITRLRSLHITQADWEKVKDMPKKELVKKYGRKKAHKILALARLEPIELNDGILLFDGSNDLSRGGIPISGEGYLHKKTHSAKMVLSSIFTGLLTVSAAITLTSDISWARVVYTFFKLVVLLYRMAVGYNMGAKAYNTIEVGQLQAKSNYLRQYIRFVTDKTYLSIEDKYGSMVVKKVDEEVDEKVDEEVTEATPA